MFTSSPTQNRQRSMARGSFWIVPPQGRLGQFSTKPEAEWDAAPVSLRGGMIQNDPRHGPLPLSHVYFNLDNNISHKTQHLRYIYQFLFLEVSNI